MRHKLVLKRLSNITFLFLTVILLSSCFTSIRQISRLTNSLIPGSEQRLYCRQARQYGWCSEECYDQNNLPFNCSQSKDKLTLLHCNDAGMCMWRDSNGLLIFGYSILADEAN